jgi:hypothetical protein
LWARNCRCWKRTRCNGNPSGDCHTDCDIHALSHADVHRNCHTFSDSVQYTNGNLDFYCDIHSLPYTNAHALSHTDADSLAYTNCDLHVLHIFNRYPDPDSILHPDQDRNCYCSSVEYCDLHTYPLSNADPNAVSYTSRYTHTNAYTFHYPNQDCYRHFHTDKHIHTWLDGYDGFD